MLFGRERIARQADAWVARLHGPEGLEDTAGLAAWRKADPRHEAAFQRSEALWQAAGGATRVHERIVTDARPVRSGATGARVAFASIAALLLAASGAVLLEREYRNHIEPMASVSAGPGARSLTLSDGSEVELAAGGTIATRFDGRVRRVALLAGEARFTVAHDMAHPFVVTAGDRTVTARGTVFVVALRRTGLSVTMMEGVVDVSRPSGGASASPVIRLRRGDRLQIAGTGETIIHADASSVPVADASRDYPPTPLARLVADADRVASRPIRLGDPRLGTMMVQGRFDLADSGALAAQLAAALSLDLREDAQGFILARFPASK